MIVSGQVLEVPPMKTYLSITIILRIREFGETDLFVTIFTPDKGRLKGVAKGALKSRKRFVNCLDIFSLVDLEFGLKRGGDLYFIHSGRLIDAYPGLRSDFSTLSRASYMIELTEILFPWGVADREMFQLLKGSFHLLDKGGQEDLISVIFETKAMSLGGYGVNLEKCCVCGRAYTGQGMAVFKRDRGGIACMKCQQESAVSPVMNPDTVKVMELIQSRLFNVLGDFEFTDEIMKQIKPVLKLHREYRLERRLKTFKYVE